ncbi:MAG TPA: PAS domain-containing protein [Rhizomicrobium sp.]|nr:PAS domain-containing protein [Rhizomicrobium sp.]
MSEHSYDRSATRAAIHQLGLGPRSQKFAASWLSAWQGNHLPSPSAFSPDRLRKLRHLLVVCAVKPDASTKITYAGEELARITGIKLVGVDWYSLVSAKDMPERVQRTSAIAEGALLRTVREVKLNHGRKYSFEIITAPLRAEEDGTVHVATFFDWNPPDKKAVLLSPQELTSIPVLAQFVPIARVGDFSRKPERELKDDQRVKVVSQAAVRFVMTFVREAMKFPAFSGLDPTDYLIIITIDSQNVAHVESDPNISVRYAGLIEPDWMRRGISRAAVSRATHVPLETVRRRINQLIEKGILKERKDGIIVTSSNRFDLASRAAKMRVNAQLVERFIAELRLRGIVFR